MFTLSGIIAAFQMGQFFLQGIKYRKRVNYILYNIVGFTSHEAPNIWILYDRIYFNP
jgi:hypothetical protein